MPSDVENDVWDSDELFGEFNTAFGTDIFVVRGRGRSPTLLARAYGIWLIGHMPERGLPETVANLRDLFEFYAFDSVPSLPSPTQEKVQARITRELPSS